MGQAGACVFAGLRSSYIPNLKIGVLETLP